MKRKLISYITILLMVFTLLTPTFGTPKPASAATPTDIQDHWAYTYILRGIQLGFINGYPDGTFLPDNPVSRAEFAKMVNAALGNNGMASMTFSDVPSYEWFYQDVSKAVSATYVAGYDDGTFLPNKAISRQEAAVMIARIVPSYGSTANLAVYPDGSRVADWANEYVKKVVGKGYLGAYDDGLLHPEDSLTRAQTAKIICSILDKETIVKSFTTITEDETVKKNTLYTNTVTMSKDLDDGEATFSNCVMLGGILINGGGTGTITLENSRVSYANIKKTASSVRVLAKGSTTIPRTTADETALLETKSLAGGAFGMGFASVDIKAGADITFTGYFPQIYVIGASGKARLDGCSVDNLTVSSAAKNSDIYLDSRSLLKVTDVNAISSFHGTGTIQQMNANVSGITYETKPNKWTLAAGITQPSIEDPDVAATFDPLNGKTNVALTVKPTISFTTEIETYGGDAITATYLKNNLVFRKGSSSGTDVAFTATLSSNKRVITVTPTSTLDSSQAYYLGFANNKFRAISSEESIPAKSAVFTTVNITPTVSIQPLSGAVQVASNTAVRVTFSDDILNASGTTPTVADLTSNITITASGSLTNLNTSATLSGKVVTILPPSGGWLDGTTYTVTVKSGAFKNSAGGFVALTRSTFTAGASAPILTIHSLDPATTSIIVRSSSTIEGTAYYIATTGSIDASTLAASSIVAGRDSLGNPCPSGSYAIGTTAANYPLSGVTGGTTYYVYGTIYGNGQYSAVVKYGPVTTNLPSANLSSLTYVYGDGSGTVPLSSTTGSITLSSAAAIVTVTAVAASDTTITFGGTGVTDLGGGIATFDVTSGNVTLGITVSGASYEEMNYSFEFRRE